jgi:hypothetical protein
LLCEVRLALRATKPLTHVSAEISQPRLKTNCLTEFHVIFVDARKIVVTWHYICIATACAMALSKESRLCPLVLSLPAL